MGLSSKQVSADHRDGNYRRGIIDWDSQTSVQDSSSKCGSTRLLDLPPRPPPPPPSPPSTVVQQQQQKMEPLKCPRCCSTNTKFCYYNNYNRSQPRHFCKGCKRHWTEGGTLRNVPVGGSRKNKRLKTTNNAVTVTSAAATASDIPAAGDHPKSIFHHHHHDQKNISASTILFPHDPTIGNNGTTAFNIGIGPTSMVLHDDIQQDMKIVPFSFSSSLGYFDPISCPIPAFNNQPYSDIIGELDNVEESTVTTVMPFTSSSTVINSHPWQDHHHQEIISSGADVANYWSLSDIDSLVSADLNIPWDDLEIKPKGK